MRVAVTGATGTIGQELVRQLTQRGDEVVAVSRDPGSAGMDAVGWDALDLSGFDGVVNLAGSPIDQRWSDAGKKRIRESRIDSTRRVVEALRGADPRPRVLVSQSAEGYYPRGSAPVREDSPPGRGFLSETVQAWEAEARKAEELGVRVVLPRTGVVIARGGGALSKMLTPFKLGVGGPVAGGAQPFPWVHVADAAGALVFLLDNDAASGPFNVAAPAEDTNRTFTKALGRAVKRPTVAPIPAFAMKALYGEMAETVLDGSNPDPSRLEALGFRFRYPEVDSALSAELSSA
jgi:uncharacterized protein (TIGR01777 family)